MAQSFSMPEENFAQLQAQHASLLERFQRVDHAPGEVRLTEIVAGQTARDVYSRLDETRQEMERHGATLTERRRIGRNSPCPCGSQRKYKKCCIGRTAVVPAGRMR